MKEVNDVVQKMSGSDRPVPVWTEFGEEFVSQPNSQAGNNAEKRKPLLFSVAVRYSNLYFWTKCEARATVYLLWST